MELDPGALIDAYRKGSVEAMNTLVEEYRRPLYAFIWKMRPSDQDADEIFQEVWFRAIRHIHRFRSGSFLSWIFRIAHNLMIDRARKSKHRLDLHRENEGDEDREERLVDDRPSPSDAAASSDDIMHLKKAIEKLPAEQREVVLLRMDSDLSFKEIARIQRVSINTALARMQYALNKLREELPFQQEQGL